MNTTETEVVELDNRATTMAAALGSNKSSGNVLAEARKETMEEVTGRPQISETALTVVYDETNPTRGIHEEIR